MQRCLHGSRSAFCEIGAGNAFRQQCRLARQLCVNEGQREGCGKRYTRRILALPTPQNELVLNHTISESNTQYMCPSSRGAITLGLSQHTTQSLFSFSPLPARAFTATKQRTAVEGWISGCRVRRRDGGVSQPTLKVFEVCSSFLSGSSLDSESFAPLAESS